MAVTCTAEVDSIDAIVLADRSKKVLFATNTNVFRIFVRKLGTRFSALTSTIDSAITTVKRPLVTTVPLVRVTPLNKPPEEFCKVKCAILTGKNTTKGSSKVNEI